MSDERKGYMGGLRIVNAGFYQYKLRLALIMLMGSYGKKDGCFVVERINIQALDGKRECQGAQGVGCFRVQRLGFCSNWD